MLNKNIIPSYLKDIIQRKNLEHVKNFHPPNSIYKYKSEFNLTFIKGPSSKIKGNWWMLEASYKIKQLVTSYREKQIVEEIKLEKTSKKYAIFYSKKENKVHIFKTTDDFEFYQINFFIDKNGFVIIAPFQNEFDPLSTLSLLISDALNEDVFNEAK